MVEPMLFLPMYNDMNKPLVRKPQRYTIIMNANNAIVNFKVAVYRRIIIRSFTGDPSGVRTLDPQIKSLLLYQLS
jgi:hypothetical protein